MTPADGAPRLRPLRGADHRQVLLQALQARAAGEVPLVGDERWSDEHWAEVVAAVEASTLPDETAWATFTSGSSGRPRVVLRSAASWEVAFDAVDAALDAGPGDRILLPVHPVSSMTLFGLAHAAARTAGFSVPASARLTTADLDGPTLLHGTPWHLRELVELLEGGARCSIRSALIGGAALDPELAARARARGLRVVGYAGAAELSFVAFDHGDGLRPLDGVEVRLRDHELWVRTPQAALTTLGGGPMRRDGDWLTVGDRASLDDDGVLTLHGRADEAILTAGATVSPADVEAELERLDGVSAALVVGAPEPRAGQLVLAGVEVAPDGPSTAALRRAARDRLAPAQRPRRWHRVARLPRTGSGKVRRLDAAELRALPRLEEEPAAARGGIR